MILMLFSQCYILSLYSVFCLTPFVTVQGKNCNGCRVEDVIIRRLTWHLTYLTPGRALLSCRLLVLGNLEVEVGLGQYELLSITGHSL